MKKIRTPKEVKESIFKGLDEAIMITENLVTNSKLTKNENLVLKGKDIVELRNKSNLTKNIFAQKIGVSENLLANLEKNKFSPSGPAKVLLYSLKNNPSLINEISV